MSDTYKPASTELLRVSVIGAVGVPARYGGFETLVENLAIAAASMASDIELTIYCSAKFYPDQTSKFHGAILRYAPFNANGAQSVLYDTWSLLSAIFARADVIIVLGVSSAIAMPFVRWLKPSRIITNVDGIEWKRAKWNHVARWFLNLSERMAVMYSHAVIADNDCIATHISKTYGVLCQTIPYGGDHALVSAESSGSALMLPEVYGLMVSRIEPENNVSLIVEAFAKTGTSLVVVGNWSASSYGRKIREEFGMHPHLFLIDPIYELSVLATVRKKASFYVHGHSAGGTNPSLVEAMHFHRDIFAFDCGFNRSTTEDQALYFRNRTELEALLISHRKGDVSLPDGMMKEIAIRRYTWAVVAQQYFDLIRDVSASHGAAGRVS